MTIKKTQVIFAWFREATNQSSWQTLFIFSLRRNNDRSLGSVSNESVQGLQLSFAKIESWRNTKKVAKRLAWLHLRLQYKKKNFWDFIISFVTILTSSLILADEKCFSFELDWEDVADFIRMKILLLQTLISYFPIIKKVLI